MNTHTTLFEEAPATSPDSIDTIATIDTIERDKARATLRSIGVDLETMTPDQIAAAIVKSHDDAPDFDWTKENPDVVIAAQPQTAIYENPYGSIVIRQEANYPDEDPFVFFRPENLPALIDKLQSMSPTLPQSRRARQ